MADPSTSSTGDGKLTCWLLDTRNLWPGKNIQQAASSTLDLLSPDERLACTKKIFIADARLSLGSALLKRLFVSQSLGVPWSSVTIARKGDPKHGKPAAKLSDGSFAPIDFNVTHQAGIVALIGYVPLSLSSSKTSPIQVGVDVTCVNERRDLDTIDQHGFDYWIDIYEFVFSDEERWEMKYNVDSVTLLDGRVLTSEDLGRSDRCVKRNQQLTVSSAAGQQEIFSSDLLIDAKFRRFYAFWAYKEAYIKLVGEALLAPWLKELVFQNVRSPKPGTVARCSTHGAWGEKVEDADVLLHGSKVEDVKMALQAFEEDYMIATAVKGEAGAELPPFKTLDLQSDILAYARK